MLGGVCIMGMTEKRFQVTQTTFGSGIYDFQAENELCESYDEDAYSEVCKKLNELAEENKDKKAMIEFLSTENTQIMNELKTRTQIQHQLEEENEQLGNELNTYKESNKLLKQTIDRLQKENEKLKQENQKLESLWEDKCIREYTKIVGEYALEEMHKEKYGDKE